MEDYLIYVYVIVTFIIGFIIGWVSCYRANGIEDDGEYEEEYYMYEDPDTGEEIEITKTVHLLIEKDEGIFYAYNADTSEYVAQGNSEDILKQNIVDRYPNVFFTIDPENLKDVGL